MSYRRDDAWAPPSLFPDYGSTRTRAPLHPPLRVPQTRTETTGPAGWDRLMRPALADLTTQHAAMP